MNEIMRKRMCWFWLIYLKIIKEKKEERWWEYGEDKCWKRKVVYYNDQQLILMQTQSSRLCGPFIWTFAMFLLRLCWIWIVDWFERRRIMRRTRWPIGPLYLCKCSQWDCFIHFDMDICNILSWVSMIC